MRERRGKKSGFLQRKYEDAKQRNKVSCSPKMTLKTGKSGVRQVQVFKDISAVETTLSRTNLTGNSCLLWGFSLLFFNFTHRRNNQESVGFVSIPLLPLKYHPPYLLLWPVFHFPPSSC